MTADQIKAGATYAASNGDRERTVVRVETVTDEMEQRAARVPAGQQQVVYTISGPYRFDPFVVPLADFADWAEREVELDAVDDSAPSAS